MAPTRSPESSTSSSTPTSRDCRFDSQYSFFQHNNNCPKIGILPGVANPTICDAESAVNYPFPKGSVVDGRAIDGNFLRCKLRRRPRTCRGLFGLP